MRITSFKAIFTNTLEKEARSKTLIITFIFTLGLIFLVNSGMDFMISMVPEEAPIDLSSQKINLLYFFVSAWSVIISILFGSNLVSSDIESGVAPTLFALPVSRTQYLMARIIGCSALVFLYNIFSIVVAIAILKLSDGNPGVSSGLIVSMLMTMLIVLGSISLSVLVSFYFGKMWTFLGTLLFSVVISSTNALLGSEKLTEMFSDFSVMKGMGILIYWLFPHFGTISSIGNTFLTDEPIKQNIYFECVHFVVTISLLLFVINLILKRKEV